MREAEQISAITAGEWEWSSRFTAEREASGESRRIGGDAPSRGECSVERTPDEIGEVISNHVRVATAQLELRKDGESGGGVRVEHGGGELHNMFGAREAEQLFNVSGAERVHA
jgi:hypothetical protein